MKNIARKVAGKLAYEWSEISVAARMCLSSVAHERDTAQAISKLQSISPDLGKSCWTEREPDYENRSCQLSVIVPAYNVEKYIVDCLESILQQQVTFDYEILVVNDGSTDKTPALLENYSGDERIRIIHQDNGGLSAARNTGIACSNGEYLCFVDSDDVLPEGSLEALMSVALEEQAKLVVGSYERCHRNGTVQYIRKLLDAKAENNRIPGFAWGRVIHYSVFRNLMFPEGYWFEDSVMAQIVHPLCETSTYTTSQICYRYYLNEKGITTIAKGNPKSIDSLWITGRLLEDRQKFGLSLTTASYGYFLSMVKLTYHRTKHLGVQVAQSIFSVQKILLEQYYVDYQIEDDRQKRKIQDALRANNFRKYVCACERNR